MKPTPFRRPALRVLALTSLLFSSAAFAGPDVTHSDLHDTARYGPVTAPGGGSTYGYAWGSNTCNIGDQPLSWVNFGSPALAMNAYRLHNGRLLQIGMGWCKHSCCVANGSGCGVTCSSIGTGLRPGCRDVYSAGFNGGQARLGPRSGINAYDSTFSAIPAFTGNAVDRRVQIIDKDMRGADLPGAQFFAEGVYVCLEEAPLQALNNATYRRATVDNLGAAPTYAWTVAGVSSVGRPAIYAWADHGLGPNLPDPSVKVVVADIMGEGRLFMAGKVRALPGNLFAYDYAIYNLNSHRSAASFTLPFPAAAAIIERRYDAPTYQVGEPYDNSPWVVVRSGDTLTFRTNQTFAQNPNSNPVRWGSMYAFGFTSAAAPASVLGEASIGLFRPGTPATTTASGLPVPCVAPAPTTPQLNITACRDLPVVLAIEHPVSPFPLTFQWQIEDILNPGTFMNLANAPGPCAIAGTSTTNLLINCATDADQGTYRCLVSSNCGSVPALPIRLNVCVGDFNCDGGTDGQDLESFFNGWVNADPYADVDSSGGIDGSDVTLFLNRWSGGC